MTDLKTGLVKRADGTFVESASLGSRPGFNTQVSTGARPESNVKREFGNEVAGTLFRTDVLFESVATSYHREN